jgi:hypothetical protein
MLTWQADFWERRFQEGNVKGRTVEGHDTFRRFQQSIELFCVITGEPAGIPAIQKHAHQGDSVVMST